MLRGLFDFGGYLVFYGGGDVLTFARCCGQCGVAWRLGRALGGVRSVVSGCRVPLVAGRWMGLGGGWLSAGALEAAWQCGALCASPSWVGAPGVVRLGAAVGIVL